MKPEREPAPDRFVPRFRLSAAFLAWALLSSSARAELAAARPSPRKTITLLHFSDYHSHAVPFFTGAEEGAAGIARAIHYLAPFAKDPGALVLSGGDMLNRGAPAFSDKYGCVEWPWLDGIVSAMAFGNHDAEHGADALARCRASIHFPILSANTVGEDGRPLFAPFAVFERKGLRIGVFAVAGPDFTTLVKPDELPSKGTRFLDPIAAAREVVARLRGRERVNAVVMIGHQQHDADEALARAVPGIDVIFGTHSHRKEDLTLISGTRTYTLSPFQYLAYVGRVDLTFERGSLKDVRGGLVRMSRAIGEEAAVAQRVAELQRELENDPTYAPLFVTIGRAGSALETEGQVERDAPLPDLVMDAVRVAVRADVALSVTSAFREPIASGVIREETLRAALPYPNKILVYELPGPLLKRLLDASAGASGTDAFLQVSGLRFEVSGGSATDVRIVGPAGEAPLSTDAQEPLYRVALTDFTALVAPRYKELLAPFRFVESDVSLRDALRDHISSSAGVTAHADGRIRRRLIEAGAPAKGD
jgi:5'-nucleotidase